VRVCLVYDCLFPWTVGGAERWYRELAERLAAEGHEVSYLTLRQWERDDPPRIPGVDVVAVGPRLGLYSETGRRRILPPLVFGAGVLAHLLHHGARYRAVHTASFPYFSLLAAGAARPLHGFALVVDWFEVWSRGYWREYLGRAGVVGHAIQRLCARLPQRAFCFSALHAGRLRAEGLRAEATVLTGLYGGDVRGEDAGATAAGERDVPVVVFAGRHIPEKRVPALVPAIARARRALPALRAEILGDGPERAEVVAGIARAGLQDVVRAPGFVAPEEVDAALRGALCLALPSRREGYGLVVVEAAARGTPSVVAAGEDNAAVELVEEGVNGFVAPSAAPEDLAAAIVRVSEAGDALRASTARWFAANAERLSVEGSLRRVVEAYAASARA
jgi:glycosyltransferase involved in cell wall biosynthesis